MEKEEEMAFSCVVFVYN